MFSSNATQVSGGYQISRSLRFNSADSPYLNRTPGSAGNRTTWTWSAWVKRGDLSAATRGLFGAGTASSTDTGIYWTSGDKIDFFDRSGGSLTGYVTTNAVFRDSSAWYHIVVVFDSGNATAANRMLIYINNVLQSLTVNNTLPQNTQSAVNNTVGHNLGSLASASNFNNGYMTEVNFIDGQALTPSSFGEYNADTGVWQPKAYGGSYGTNGFYLNFSDNSNTTAATLGKDYSGNGNNWTPNNFSVSAGAGNDSLVDNPTSYGTDTGVGGTVRGNYATMNPLALGASGSLANGNLDVSYVTGGRTATGSTIGLTSGKWYWEATITATSLTNTTAMLGLTTDSAANISTSYPGSNASSWGYYGNDGTKYNAASASAYGAVYGLNDVIGIAFDADAGTLTFYKNGTSQGTAFSGLTSGPYYPAIGNGASSYTFSASFNFGQRPFAYTAPSGFKALCTQNLPTPTVGATATTQAGKYFNTITWTGNDVANRTFTGVGFQPDFVWVKDRTNAYSHLLYDVLRGAGANTELSSNLTVAEGGTNADTYGYLAAFASDGFTTSNSYPNFYFNSNSDAYVAWNWKANGAGSTNTAGSITSTVSANTTAGFSVVTYTGTGANATVGHGLGVAPKMLIVKLRSAGGTGWVVYHAALSNPPSQYMLLNTTDANQGAATVWNSTGPTSSVFSIGTAGGTNTSSATYVAYCFAEVQGFSKAFSYTGNGSADGPFVFTGMRPAYVLLKRTDTTGNWIVWDAVRNTFNVVGEELYPNLSNAAATATDLDLLSNGFKLRNTTADFNASGGTYVGFAFASTPFKFALAR